MHSLATTPAIPSGAVFVRYFCSPSGLLVVWTPRGPLPAAVAEGSIVELQTEVVSLRKQMVQVNSTVGRLETRLQDAEGRSRLNNIRLLVFPERAEGAKVEVFVDSWIKDELQPVGLSRVFVVEQAHRALVTPPRPGAPPRAISARLLNYKNRDCILREACESESGF
ncbi:hypothetical protein NDU88_003898 [Pleurodeles waltl]|uniref:Uncharacterized protein n=1 Tax=Pleurodeles waltl TaxID=8319 RepID=A0AAV7W4S8_PLEWA|nr:hypothetical protein NDU88_003898 [Pleurodeles waltl]